MSTRCLAIPVRGLPLYCEKAKYHAADGSDHEAVAEARLKTGGRGPRVLRWKPWLSETVEARVSLRKILVNK